jgi:hypothetical protein
MRRPQFILASLLLAALVALMLALPGNVPADDGEAGDSAAMRGGTYSITWDVIAAGGGTSVGGAYSVSDTIGQAVVGSASGGAYGVQSGYWVVILPGAVPSGGMLIY